MAFFESKNQYHRYNFYEIKKILANGEDVRTVVPRNPAEVSVISNMLGGSSGSSTSGVPIHIYNNPNLKGLYYSLVTSNGFTKFVFDFPKFINALETYGIFNKTTLDDNVPTGSDVSEVRVLCLLGSMNNLNIKITSNELRIELDNESYSSAVNYEQLGVNGESLTYRTLFNLIGKAEVSLVNENGECFSGIVVYIDKPYLGSNPYSPKVDLNEYPIDYMWFE